jgi:hypothetical protein
MFWYQPLSAVWRVWASVLWLIGAARPAGDDSRAAHALAAPRRMREVAAATASR